MTTKTGPQNQTFVEKGSALFLMFGMLIAILGIIAPSTWLVNHSLPGTAAAIGFCIGVVLYFAIGLVLTKKFGWHPAKSAGLAFIAWGFCTAIGSGILIIPGYSGVVAVNGQHTSLGRRVMFVIPLLDNAVGVQLEQTLVANIAIKSGNIPPGTTIDETHTVACRFPAEEDIILRLALIKKILSSYIRDKLQADVTSSVVSSTSADMKVATNKTIVDASLMQMLKMAQLPTDACILRASERRTLLIHTVSY